MHTLHSDDDLDRAMVVADALLDRDDLSADEEEYLAVLGALIEAYEEEHVPIPPARGIDVLRHLMEARSMAQSDLVPLLGTKSIASEVLSGKRRLALAHIQRLSTFFRVPADVFIDPASPAPAPATPPARGR